MCKRCGGKERAREENLGRDDPKNMLAAHIITRVVVRERVCFTFKSEFGGAPKADSPKKSSPLARRNTIRRERRGTSFSFSCRASRRRPRVACAECSSSFNEPGNIKERKQGEDIHEPTHPKSWKILSD